MEHKVTLIIFRKNEENLEVLVEKGVFPFAITKRENLDILKNKILATLILSLPLVQLNTYSYNEYYCTVYFGIISEENINLEFRNINEFLNTEYIKDSLKYLEKNIYDLDIMKQFMPKVFTLKELQELIELVTYKELDRRNFRKMMLNRKILIEEGIQENVKGRPSKRYSFIERNIEYE